MLLKPQIFIKQYLPMQLCSLILLVYLISFNCKDYFFICQSKTLFQQLSKLIYNKTSDVFQNMRDWLQKIIVN